MTFIKNNFKYCLYIVALISMYYTYRHQISYPCCFDPATYQIIAKLYLKHGLFINHTLACIRLYAFPFLLSLFYSVFGLGYGIVFFLLFLCFSYVILSFLIVQKLKIYTNKSNILHFAFAGNIFLFPYLTILLSDGLNIIVLMLIFYLFLQIINCSNKKLFFVLLFFCSFLIGMSIMIRPTNINLVILLPVLIGIGFFVQKKTSKIAIFFLVFFGFLLAISPQIYINFIFFNKLTFLPAIQLENLQVQWGIKYIKYGTNLSEIKTWDKEAQRLLYINPFYTHGEHLGLNWYFLNFGKGIKTILLHCFNAFTYDYYFPYIYNLYPKYKILTQLYGWFILFFGVFGIFELFNKIKDVKSENFKIVKFLTYVVLPLVFFSSLAMLSISAIEIRFSLPLITILLPFAYLSFCNNLKNIKLWSFFGLWIYCAYLISSFVDLQKNIPSM